MYYSLLTITLIMLWYVTRFRLNAVLFFSGFFIFSYLLGVPRYFEISLQSKEIELRYIFSAFLYVNSFICGAFVSQNINTSYITGFIYQYFISINLSFSPTEKLKIWLVVFISFLIGCYYFRYGIPMLSSNPNNLRFKAAAGASPMLFMLTTLMPIYLFIAVEYKSKFLVAITYVLVLILCFLTAYRTAPAKILIASFIKKENYYRPSLLKKAFALVFLISLFFYITMQKFSDFSLEEVIDRVIDRLFIVDIGNSLFVIKIFPNYQPFMYGEAFWMDASRYIPNGLETFGLWMNKMIFGYDGVSSNPSFTVLWADWGYFLFLPMFILGFIVNCFDKVNKNYELNVNEKIIWSFAVVVIGMSSTSPYTKTLYYTIPMFIYFFLVNNFIKTRIRL